MTFNDIKEFTYIGNTVIIDGENFKISSSLSEEITAVQFHKGYEILEEPLITVVPESKYQFAIDEWLSAKTAFEAEVEVEVEVEVEIDETIITVTMRQARLALLQSDLLLLIQDAIDTGSDEELKIEWEYATSVDRNWASLISLCDTLGITETKINDLFTLAKTL